VFVVLVCWCSWCWLSCSASLVRISFVCLSYSVSLQLRWRNKCSFTMPSEEEMRSFFDKFDKEKQGWIPATSVATILKTMGVQFNTATLRQLITEFDEDGSGTFEFDEFCALVSSVEEDEPASAEELRDIFRLFDKQAQGFITTAVLREILAQLDDKLTKEDLDAAIDEIDEDGSGTVDFAEFTQMMNG